jgi:type I restriction enzyme S subunit
MSNLSDVMTLPLQIPETIPNDWSWRNLVELCNPKQWKTISNSDLTEMGYRVFGANGFIGFYHEFNHEDETISVTCRGATCGTVNLIPPRTYITGNSMCLDNLSKEVNKVYLFYATQFRTFSDVISGSAQPQITGEGLKKVSLPVPPLPEQKKIASILTSVDKVIKNTQKQIDKLQDLKKATMNELLTKGIGHTEFKDSELGRIPKSWEVASLGDLLISRPSNGVSPPETEDENHLLSLSLGCLTNDGFSLVKTKMVEKRKNFESSLLVDKDFLISRSNTRQLVGLVGIVRGLPTGFIYPDLMMRLTISDKVKKTFLEYLMLSPSHRKLISNLAQGTSDTMVKLNSESVRQIPIQLPSLTEQKEIVHILTSIKNRVLSLSQKLSQTQSLKKSLMQDLLTGNVRVTVN